MNPKLNNDFLHYACKVNVRIVDNWINVNLKGNNKFFGKKKGKNKCFDTNMILLVCQYPQYFTSLSTSYVQLDGDYVSINKIWKQTFYNLRYILGGGVTNCKM